MRKTNRMTLATRGFPRAFTLIEMLVVIAVIAILAALLLPAFSRARIISQKKVAQTEEVNLVAAITQYQNQYGRLPASVEAHNAAAAENPIGGNSNDFTFGTYSNFTFWSSSQVPSVFPIVTTGESSNWYQNFNSEVISILRDDNVFPETSSNGTQHVYNQQQTCFFNAKLSGDTSSPGIGTNDVFLDPWGCPYIITLDLNYDNKCFDNWLNSMYMNNLSQPTSPLMVPGPAIVWSLGPARTYNPTAPLSTGANHQSIVTSF